jgi:hypothetical protein
MSLVHKCLLRKQQLGSSPQQWQHHYLHLRNNL